MAPQPYTEEFKQKAVDQVRGGVRIDDAAKQLNMPRGTLWSWVKGAGVSIPVAPRPTGMSGDHVDVSTYQAALARIAELEEENEMLRKAAAYFAKRMKP